MKIWSLFFSQSTGALWKSLKPSVCNFCILQRWVTLHLTPVEEADQKSCWKKTNFLTKGFLKSKMAPWIHVLPNLSAVQHKQIVDCWGGMQPLESPVLGIKLLQPAAVLAVECFADSWGSWEMGGGQGWERRRARGGLDISQPSFTLWHLLSRLHSMHVQQDRLILCTSYYTCVCASQQCWCDALSLLECKLRRSDDYHAARPLSQHLSSAIHYHSIHHSNE